MASLDMAEATDLLLMNLEGIAIRHLETVGSVGRLNTLALEQESDRGHALALALAESVHELLELGRSLDLEEDLVIVIRNFDVEVLGASGSFATLTSRTAAFVLA